MMSFISTVVTSCFPTTNNQLRSSSNPRQQATIHDGRVIVQPVQGRQTSFAADMSRTRANVLGTGGNNSDPIIAKGPVTKMVITHNAAYHADDLDAYDFDCDDFSTAKAVLMANLSSYGSDVLSEGTKETNVISIADYEETLMLEEESRSKMLSKQSDPMVLK
nr:hypothetical protein [Tanacetum cinerariifolium]